MIKDNIKDVHHENFEKLTLYKLFVTNSCLQTRGLNESTVPFMVANQKLWMQKNKIRTKIQH